MPRDTTTEPLGPGDAPAQAADTIDLSIVVPIYNVRDYLDACLESLRASLGAGLRAEVLCVNDGSTDGSDRIARGYQADDRRFRVIDQPNAGYGRAMNRGMTEARGRYVTIVESDDIIATDAYAEIVALLDADPGLDFVKTPYQPFTTDGALTIMSRPPQGLASAAGLCFDNSRLIFEPPAIWSGVYRAASLRRHRIALPETPGAGYQDTSFSALCMLNGLRHVWLPERYYMYRVDRDGASRHVRNRRDELLFLFEYVRRNLVRNRMWNARTIPYFYAVYFRRLIWFMQRVRVDYRQRFFLAAYRAFYDVWADEPLRLHVQSLLPGLEKTQFEDFWAGRQRQLYL